MAENMSNYNYVKKPSATPIAANTVPATHPTPKSPVSQTANLTTNTTSTKKNASTNAPKGAPSISYTNDFKDLFTPFQEIKETLKFNKLIKCFKNVANLIKNFTNPMVKMFIINKRIRQSRIGIQLLR